MKVNTQPLKGLLHSSNWFLLLMLLVLLVLWHLPCADCHGMQQGKMRQCSSCLLPFLGGLQGRC